MTNDFGGQVMGAALRWGLWLAIATTLACPGVAPAEYMVKDCPAPGALWTSETLRQCIDQITKEIDRAPAKSDRTAELFAKRALLYQRLGYAETTADGRSTAWKAALADFSAAISIKPKDADLRYKRAQLLLAMRRGKDALKDAERLLAQRPGTIGYYALKGAALAEMNRHQAAIATYNEAIAMAQSCAEASAIQRQVNLFRHAFDPPPKIELPMTHEQVKEMLERMRAMEVPEAAVVQVGFQCAPTTPNSFDDLVLYKEILLAQRGESQLALGDGDAALQDYKYAVAISRTPEFSSIRLCAIEIDLKLDYDAVDDCRRAFDSNAYAILSDADAAAKIGEFLLNDGDLKGACRIALPFVTEGMQNYLNNPNIKALQKRVRAGLEGAGLRACEAEFRTP